MREQMHDQSGFGLIEAMIAMLVLTVGAIGMATVFLGGMKAASSGPNELIATAKAAEAIESVFSARDSHTITWAQLRNTNFGGIFLPGPREMRLAGADGILDTNDDASQPIESIRFPGVDQLLNTGDDKIETLSTFRREIKITDVSEVLRSVTVTITYQAGTTQQTYSLTAYISQFA